MHTDLRRPLPGRRVHFIAIGGVGMGPLAELLHGMGYAVSGSHLHETPATRRLAGLGVPVAVGAHVAGETDGADHVVVSNAVPDDHPALAHARARGADVVMRADLLGRVLDGGRGIAVAGGAGKTSTSSMIGWALEATGLDPSMLVGGDVVSSGTGARLGSSDLVVAEADEFAGSFLHLRPEVAVVTNIHNDHLDFYGSQDAIDDAFVRFLGGRRPRGTAVLCADDAGVQRVARRVAGAVVTFGTAASADVRLSRDEGTWRLRRGGDDLGPLRLQVAGSHMALNAAGAVAACAAAGADPAAATAALARFAGVDRRFTVRGTAGGVTVVDDYAHHPEKVLATMRAAREVFGARRLVVLFQPHLYSRTRDLAEQFAPTFADADTLVVTDVYGQREAPVPGVSGRLVVDEVRRSASPPRDVRYVPALGDAAAEVASVARAGDVVLTIGAGDVTSAGPMLLELFRRGGRDDA